MKKIVKLIFCTLISFVLILNVHAECGDAELNDWASKAEVQFTLSQGTSTFEKQNSDGTTETVKKNFAYFLLVKDLPENTRLVASDVDGNTVEATTITLIDGKTLYGVGCFNNLEDETYTLRVYGTNGSACESELIKTIKYTVPAFNEYSYKDVCTDSDSELCKPYTHAADGMTDEEFIAAVEKEKTKSPATGLIAILKEYGLYIFIPLLIVSAYYIAKIKKYRQEERDR